MFKHRQGIDVRAVFIWVSKRNWSLIASTTLSDWFKKLAPLFHPIRSKTKTNRDSLIHVFPHFASATCNYFVFLIGSVQKVQFKTFCLLVKTSCPPRKKQYKTNLFPICHFRLSSIQSVTQCTCTSTHVLWWFITFPKQCTSQ